MTGSGCCWLAARAVVIGPGSVLAAPLVTGSVVLSVVSSGAVTLEARFGLSPCCTPGSAMDSAVNGSASTSTRLWRFFFLSFFDFLEEAATSTSSAAVDKSSTRNSKTKGQFKSPLHCRNLVSTYSHLRPPSATRSGFGVHLRAVGAGQQ